MTDGWPDAPGCARWCPAQIGNECECGGKEYMWDVHRAFYPASKYDMCPCAACRLTRSR